MTISLRCCARRALRKSGSLLCGAMSAPTVDPVPLPTATEGLP